MTLLIDTGLVEAPERAQFWARSSWDAYHPLHIDAASTEGFQARMWGRSVARLGLFRIHAAANTMTRTPADIAAGDPECLHLSVLLRGRLYGTQHQREAVLMPGDMTTYDTSSPAVFRAPEPFDALVLQLPKAFIGPRADKLSRLTALRIPGQTGLPRLVAHLICELAATPSPGASDDDAAAVDAVIDLAHRLCAPPAATTLRRASRAELLRQAQDYIEVHLGEPDLGPEQVARACFISTRYLHRLFEADGLSVCDWIRAQRLTRCRRDLAAPELAAEPIAVIATRWGLPRAPHFSRLFRSAYGCSPREFRRVAAAAATGAAAEAA